MTRSSPDRTGTKGARILLALGAGVSLLSGLAAIVVMTQRSGLLSQMIRSGRYDRFQALALDALPTGLFALALMAAAWTLVAWKRPAARRSLAFLLVAIAALFAWSARSEGARSASWPLIMADDFPSYYFAGRALGEGESPYSDHQARARDALSSDLGALHARHGLPRPRRPLSRAVFPYLYPPFTALLLAPLAALPYFLAQHLWTVAQIGVLALLLTLASSRSSRAGPPLIVAMLFLVLYEPFVNNAETGQINLLVALLAWGAFALDRRERLTLAGLCLGLAIQLKGAPLLLLSYFVARGRWRTVASTALAAMALMALTWVVDGGRMVGEFSTDVAPNISHVTKLILPEGLEPEALVLSNSPDPVTTFHDYPGVRVYNQAPVAFAGMLFTQLGWSGSAAVRATQALLALLWGATLWLAWRQRERSGLLVFAAATVLVLLSSPLLWQHHLVWVVAPALALVSDLRARTHWSRAGLALALLGVLLSAHDLAYSALGLVEDLSSVADVLPWSYNQLFGLLLVWTGLFVAGLSGVRAQEGSPPGPDEA